MRNASKTNVGKNKEVEFDVGVVFGDSQTDSLLLRFISCFQELQGSDSGAFPKSHVYLLRSLWLLGVPIGVRKGSRRLTPIQTN
jgi:hypothetical protein